MSNKEIKKELIQGAIFCIVLGIVYYKVMWFVYG